MPKKINVEKLEQLISSILETQGWYGRGNLFESAFPEAPKEKWVPKNGETCWYYCLDSSIDSAKFTGCIIDIEAFSQGRVFPTQAAAEKFQSEYLAWLKSRE